MKTHDCFLLVVVAAILAGGCSQGTLDSAAGDARKDVGIVAREAKRAERNARPQLKKLGLGARVTAALAANQNLPHTIRVDASETGVFLRGRVATPAQKTLAGQIARQTLSAQYSVRNDLQVGTKE